VTDEGNDETAAGLLPSALGASRCEERSMAVALITFKRSEDDSGTLFTVYVERGTPPADGALWAPPRRRQGTGEEFEIAWRSPNDLMAEALRAFLAAPPDTRTISPMLEEFLERSGAELLEHAGVEDEDELLDEHRVAFLLDVAADPEQLARLQRLESFFEVAYESWLVALTETVPLPDWASWETFADGGPGSGFDNVGLRLEPERTLDEWATWYGAPHGPPSLRPVPLQSATLRHLPSMLLEAENLLRMRAERDDARLAELLETLRRLCLELPALAKLLRSSRLTAARLRSFRLGRRTPEESRLEGLFRRRAALAACLPFHEEGPPGREGIASAGLERDQRSIATNARRELARHRAATIDAIAALDVFIVACWADRFRCPKELLPSEEDRDAEG